MVAQVQGVSVCEFSKPEWRECTPSQWRFADCEDTVLEGTLSVNSAIVYRVLRYSPATQSVSNYGFAVQPLFSRVKGQSYLI